MDFSGWLASLKRRDRLIATSLAECNGAADVGERLKIGAGSP
jgi:hypothetical protein